MEWLHLIKCQTDTQWIENNSFVNYHILLCKRTDVIKGNAALRMDCRCLGIVFFFFLVVCFLFAFSSNSIWCRTESINYAQMNTKQIKIKCCIRVEWKLFDCVTHNDDNYSMSCVLREGQKTNMIFFHDKSLFYYWFILFVSALQNM